MLRLSFVFVFFLFAHLSGAPYGNPASPHILEKNLFIPSDSWVDVRAGYEGDFVFYVPLKQEDSAGSVDKYTQTVNSGSLTVGFFKYLDLFCLFGSSQICSQWRFANPLDEILNVQMETPHSFLWAVGGRAVLYKNERWDLGFSGRYSSTDTDLRWATVDGANASVSGSNLHFHEWQLGLAASYHIDLFTPYLGLNCFFAETEIDLPSFEIAQNGSTRNHFKSKVPVGLYLGCTLSTQKFFLLNVEARLISEEAVSISGDFGF